MNWITERELQEFKEFCKKQKIKDQYGNWQTFGQ